MRRMPVLCPRCHTAQVMKGVARPPCTSATRPHCLCTTTPRTACRPLVVYYVQYQPAPPLAEGYPHVCAQGPLSAGPRDRLPQSWLLWGVPAPGLRDVPDVAAGAGAAAGGLSRTAGGRPTGARPVAPGGLPGR